MSNMFVIIVSRNIQWFSGVKFFEKKGCNKNEQEAFFKSIFGTDYLPITIYCINIKENT